MGNSVDITVSIASYNTRDLLRACLASLRARHEAGEATLQVIVADNGSTDGSLEMVAEEFPEVVGFYTGGNLGYGRANNMAFEQARGRYFLILNPDTEVPPGALATLRDFLEANPTAGGAGPQLFYPDGRLQTSYGTDPHFFGIFCEQVFLSRLVPGADSAEAQTVAATASEPREVEQICGAAQFLRAEAYRGVDGFDPAYFMYHEDVDLNIRLRRVGWKLFFVPSASIVHHLGASSSRDWQTRARMVSALNHSRYYSFSQHEGRARGAALKGLFIAGAALRLAGWSLCALARPAAREKVKLFRSVLRNAVRMKPTSPSGTERD